MGRPRRRILSKQVYEVCFRTKQGLPFMCTRYMALIIRGILARVQRDSKVILCHFLWMGNHAHIILVAQDSTRCTQFYGEVQKQLTEAIKRLMGRPKLSLWDSNGTSVIHYGDAAGVIERIAYLYANPARAHLVDTVSRYPGVSSWEAFCAIEKRIKAQSSESCPWIRQAMIQKIPCRSVTPGQDRVIVERLREEATEEHALVLQPNAWMAVFKMTDTDVAEANQQIHTRLEEFEAEARKERCARGWRVKGANKLAAEALDLSYLPRKFSRRIFVYAHDPEIRCEMIRVHQEFTERCKACYERWRLGDLSVDWPPGALFPPPPQQKNWIAA